MLDGGADETCHPAADVGGCDGPCDHVGAQLLGRYVVLAYDCADQVGFVAEVVADGCGVSLSCGFGDLSVRDGVYAVFGEEAFRGGEYSRPSVADSIRTVFHRTHSAASVVASAMLNQSIDLR